MIGRDILTRALRIAQVISQGDDITGTDQETDALAVLNSLISSLSAERLIIPHLTTDSKVLTASDGEYTFGTGGDIDSARPNRIEHAYVRDSQGNDFPVEIINVAKYDDISLKTSEGRPFYLYFIAEYPLARVKIYYEPSEAYTLIMDSWKPLTQVATAAATVSLSGEYKRMLEYALAVDIAPEYGHTLDRSVFEMAEKSMRAVKSLNSIPVAESKVDRALLANSSRGGRYNIYSDGYN